MQLHNRHPFIIHNENPSMHTTYITETTSSMDAQTDGCTDGRHEKKCLWYCLMVAVA